MRLEYGTVFRIAAQLAGLGAAYSLELAQPSPSTSIFRTANYITHGLPQQCLTNTNHTPIPLITSAATTDTSSIASRSVAGSGIVESPTATIVVNNLSSSIVYSPSGARSSPSVSDDLESPLDSVKFLSFEEWRAQNLAKAGQSSESFGERAAKEPRKRPGSGSSVLDALGDDLGLDFGFDSNEGGSAEAQWGPRTIEKPAEIVPPVWHGRSKLAGKTGRERFNYASFDCAATVHKTNPEAKSSSSILVENKDSYMLNQCRAENKFVIVELCDDIFVDTFALANFEFFSSMFRKFRVSVSDRYPVKTSGWKELGVFEARNSREIQAFLIENPLIWARYLKVEFLTHYGNEFYCPLSLLRVHGTTMIEEFRAQEEAARGLPEDDTEEEASAFEQEATNVVPSGKQAHPTPFQFVEPAGTEFKVLTTDANYQKMEQVEVYHPSLARNPYSPQPTTDIKCKNPQLSIFATSPQQCPTIYASSAVATLLSSSSLDSDFLRKNEASPTISVVAEIKTSAIQKTTTRDEAASISSRSGIVEKDNVQNPTADHGYESWASVSSTTPHQASPTTQESFYKSFHKRLQLLEANATLSLQYIEDQSRAIRDAFGKMEIRHLSKTNNFMEMLNSTVTAELNGYKQQYDQLWQSTVIELETQRKQAEREMLAVSSRLTILADEVLYQRRMSWIQSALLLVCISLLIFSKSSQLDASLTHSIRGRASALPNSPPSSPPLRNNDTPEDSPLSRQDEIRRSDSVDAGPRSSSSFGFSSPVSERPTSLPTLESPTSISSPATPTGKRNSEVDAGSGGAEPDWRVFGQSSRMSDLVERPWHRLPSPSTSIAVTEDDSDRIREAGYESNSGLSSPSSPSLPPSLSSTTSVVSQAEQQGYALASSNRSTSHQLQKPVSQFAHSRSNSSTKNKRKKKK